MPVLIAILAALAGGAAAALALWPILRRQRAREAALTTTLRTLGHDLRGAVSPGLLVAERLEANPDPSVRQSAAILMQAMERITSLAITLSRLTQDGH